MRKIQPTDVAVSVDTDVAGLDRMLAGTADKSGTDEKSVAVVMRARSIVIECADCLNRITLEKKILAVEVRDKDVLVAELFKRIQIAVRILLELAKIRDVELRLVVRECTEHASTEIVVRV